MQAPRFVADYYSRDDVAKRICEAASGREAVGTYMGSGYDSRPNIIQYPSDVQQLAEKGITSFHISVERWKNAMQLSAESGYDEMRKGWDLLIDMDSKAGMEAAKIAAIVVCDFLDGHGVRGYGIKFSGSRGFHICIPWNGFPERVDFKELAREYPKIPRIIISYMKEKIRQRLFAMLIEKIPAHAVSEAAAMKDPYKVVEIEQDWGARHLFRAPYSLNEKTWYASVPLTRRQLEKFNISMANPVGIDAEKKFFPENADAERLLMKALDWHAFMKREEGRKPVIRAQDRGKASEKSFPPCMKNILSGLADGRKRSVFSLITFLRNVGWDWAETEARLEEWNAKNPKPLPQNYIRSQLNWHTQQKRSINPTNCFNELHYMSIGVCKPDDTCKLIKNPMNYPFRKMKLAKRFQPQKENAQYACHKCEKKYASMKSLQAHITRVH